MGSINQYHQRRRHQIIGGQRHENRKGRQHTKSEKVIHACEHKYEKPDRKNDGGDQHRATGGVKGFINGLFGVAALFIVAAEVMHKMDGIVHRKSNGNTGDHHGEKIHLKRSRADDPEHEQDRRQIWNHAEQADPETPDQNDHECRDHNQGDDIAAGHTDDGVVYGS